MKKYEVLVGRSIYTATAELVHQANLHNESVSMEFNGVTVVAQPGSTAIELYAQWSVEMDRRAEEYRNSPESKRAAREAKVRKNTMQRAVDELMQHLEILDYSNLDELIQFFDDLTDPSSHSDVSFDYQRIVDTFTQHGFIVGANTDFEFDEEDRDNFARYLIGQALSCLLSVGAVHSIYHQMAQDWRDKFVPAGSFC